MAQPTGLQWLAKTVFPSILQGIAGRWLLIKLFDILKDKKLIPSSFTRWLYRPVGDIEASVDLEERPPREERKAVAAAIREAELEDEELMALATRVLAVLDPDIEIPDADEVTDFLDELSDYVDGKSGDTDVEDWDGDDVTIIYAAVIKSPASGRYPKSISTKGKPLWDEMVEDFADEIKGLGKGDKYREWAAAILIYQRLCKEERVRPFERGTQRLSPHSGDTSKRRRKAVRRLNTAYKHGNSYLIKFLGFLQDKFDVQVSSRGLLNGQPRYMSNGEYLIRYYFRLNMSGVSSHTKKAIREALRKKRWVKGHRAKSLIYEHRHMRFRLMLEGESKDEWRIYLAFPLSETEGIYLTGERDKAGILEGLKKITRVWKRDGRFPSDV